MIEDYTDVKAYTDAVISLSRKSTLKDKDKFQELLNKAIVFHGNIKVQLERSTGFTHFKTFQELKASLKEISKDSLPGQVAKQKAKDITQLALPGLSTDKSIELKPKSEEEIKENLERLRHQTSLPGVEVDQDTFSADDMNNSMDVKMRIKRLKERYNIFSKYRSIRSAITQNIKDLKSKTKKFIILLAKPVKKIKEDKKEEIDAYELDLALEEIKNSFELLNKAIDSYVEMYKQWFRGKGSEEEKKNFIHRERERMTLDNTMRAGLR